MKPAPFDYAAPQTLAEVLSLLGEHAKPLAGGQSLVPLLNFRLARPRLLVDLNGVAGLAGIRRSGGTLWIGAMTRQAALARSGIVAAGWPVLRDAVRHAGHPQTRSRGTVGGSVAHADPAAEIPCALAALDARFHVRSARGARTVCADELFAGPLRTTLEPDELIVAIELPAVAPGTRMGFREHARTNGAFAIAGVAVVGERVALLGVAPTTIVVSSITEARIADPWKRALVENLYAEAV